MKREVRGELKQLGRVVNAALLQAHRAMKENTNREIQQKLLSIWKRNAAVTEDNTVLASKLAAAAAALSHTKQQQSQYKSRCQSAQVQAMELSVDLRRQQAECKEQLLSLQGAM